MTWLAHLMGCYLSEQRREIERLKIEAERLKSENDELVRQIELGNQLVGSAGTPLGAGSESKPRADTTGGVLAGAEANSARDIIWAAFLAGAQAGQCSVANSLPPDGYFEFCQRLYPQLFSNVNSPLTVSTVIAGVVYLRGNPNESSIVRQKVEAFISGWVIGMCKTASGNQARRRVSAILSADEFIDLMTLGGTIESEIVGLSSDKSQSRSSQYSLYEYKLP